MMTNASVDEEGKPTTEVWQHARSGDRVVVLVDADRHVIEAVGPLHYREIDDCLFRQSRDCDPALAEDLNDSDIGEWLVAFVAGGADCVACQGPGHFEPCVDVRGLLRPGYPITVTVLGASGSLREHERHVQRARGNWSKSRSQ